MKRFFISLTIFLTTGILCSTLTVQEQDDSSVISASSPIEVTLTYPETGKLVTQTEYKRPAENIPVIVGNWFVEWCDYPEKGQVSLATYSLSKEWTIAHTKTEDGANCYFHRQDSSSEWSVGIWHGEGYSEGYRTYNVQISSENTKIEIGHHHFILGYWGGNSVVSLIGPNEVKGKWLYRDEGGAEVWRRAIPKIKRVKFVSEIETEVVNGKSRGRVEGTYDSFWWSPSNDMRGNRPNFWIEVYGENLWGHHVVDLGGAADLEPLEFSYIQSDGGWSGVPGKVIGLKFEVVIWPKFSPGPKAVFIDGIKIPFDFAVKGYPASEVKNHSAEDQTCKHWPLWYHIAKNRYENVKKCLEEGADPNEENLGAPVFFGAEDKPEILKLLIKYGAKVNLADYTGETLLMRTAKNNRLESAKILLDAGADVNKRSKKNHTALYFAAGAGHTDILKLLLDQSADLNVAAGGDEKTAIMAAAENGHVDAVKYLLDAGAAIDAVNRDCMTALYLAARNGHLQVVEKLVAAGAIPNILDNVGYAHDTAATIAIKRKHVKVAETIYEKGRRVQNIQGSKCKLKVEHIKIDKLEIDYSKWRSKKRALEYDLGALSRQIESLKKQQEREKGLQQNVSQGIEKLEDEYEELVKQREALLGRGTAIPNDLKDEQYVKEEKQLAALHRRINRIDDAITELLEDKPGGYRASLGNLAEAHKEVAAELKAHEKKLGQLQIELGIDKVLEERKKTLAGLTDKILRTRNKLLSMRFDADYSNRMTGKYLDKLLALEKTYDEKSRALVDLDSLGIPLVTEIRNDHYHARLWKPGKTIKDLDNLIFNLSEKMRTFAKRKDEYWKEVLIQGQIVNRKSEELIDNIYKSMCAQAGVEGADFAVDVVKSFAQKGPAGVLSESIKKAVDIAVFGLPEYYDATQKPPDDFMESVIKNLPTAGKKALFKKAIGGRIDSAVDLIDAFLIKKDPKQMDLLFEMVTEQTWYTKMMKRVSPGLQKRLMIGLDKELESRAADVIKYKIRADAVQSTISWKMVGKHTVKNLFKGMVVGAAKEAAMAQAKRYLAEYFEGRAMQEYMQAQFKYQTAANQFMAQSDICWMTKDAYDALREIRKRLVSAYDPESSMLIDKNTVWPFYEDYLPYSLRVTVYGLDPSADMSHAPKKRLGKMRVEIGGVTAQQHRNEPEVYLVPPEKVGDINSSKEKGAVLKISVLE